MKRPIWFHKNGRLHWMPCTGQGWTIVGGFVVLLTGWMAQAAPKSPALAAIGAVCGSAAIIAIAMATDDTHG